MEVEWQKTSDIPDIKRGGDIKVWGLVDIYRYQFRWGAAGADGKATRTAILESVDRRVVELRFANTAATEAELSYFHGEGQWPDESPGWLDDWLTEDAEFVGTHGFYNEYPEEGRMYWEHFEKNDAGQLQITNRWNETEVPDRILLAWAKFERPPVPENLPWLSN